MLLDVLSGRGILLCISIQQAHSVNHLHIGRLCEAEELIDIPGAGNLEFGTVCGATAYAQIADSDCPE